VAFRRVLACRVIDAGMMLPGIVTRSPYRPRLWRSSGVMPADVCERYFSVDTASTSIRSRMENLLTEDRRIGCVPDWGHRIHSR